MGASAKIGAMTGQARHSNALAEAAEEAARVGVGGYDRHVFLCIGPDCCTPEEGAAAWSHLKKGVAELNKRDGSSHIARTKVGCLRICRLGPTAVVYPEGTWYGGLDPAGLERVLRDDLGGGQRVEDLVIGENPLP